MVAQMVRSRMVWASGSLAVGLLQAWDSNAFESNGLVRMLAVAGVVLPAAAIAAFPGRGAALTGLIAGAVLLTWARAISPASMNAVHIALFVPAMYVFFAGRLDAVPRRQGQA